MTREAELESALRRIHEARQTQPQFMEEWLEAVNKAIDDGCALLSACPEEVSDEPRE